jgi:hemerythrin-like domain-containing protein
MKRDITQTLIQEHRLILRMLAILEQKAELTVRGADDDYRFYLTAVDFIRNYADRFHHAKEEDVLFEALVNNGMPRANSPVAAMLLEHDQGRAFVKALEEAATEAQAGQPGRDRDIAANALGYVNLLREHISREDGILYPLAERVIPEGLRDGIIAGYRQAGERTPAGFEDHCRQIVEQYEADMLKRAA